MESNETLMVVLRRKLKQASLLWLEGFKEACCLHRVIIYYLKPKSVSIEHILIFWINYICIICSIFILKSLIIPTLQWILPDHFPAINVEEPCSFGGILKLYSFLRVGLIQLFYVLWFYPLYIFSFILSNIWYIDIAKYGFFAIGKHGPAVTKPSNKKESPTSQSSTRMDRPTDLGGVMIVIAEQVYSVLLLSFFFLEVYVTGYVPYIGKAINFLLLSWMYAYYCFEYKWNLSGLSLDKRLDFFETNWAFFLGFGNPCVLAIFLFSPLVSFGVMAILFPLFVLTATGSDADKVIDSQRRKWRGAGLGKLPIFCVADYLSMRVLSFFPTERWEQMQDERREQMQDEKAL
ncbi:hypothetical protein LguiA_027039 [Lonicera macranthoides]